MPHKCVFGCWPGVTPMHRFPNLSKFPDRFRIWVNLVGGKLETQSDYENYKKKRVCDRHFTESDHNRFGRLNASAVPSCLTQTQGSEQHNRASALTTIFEDSTEPQVSEVFDQPSTSQSTHQGAIVRHVVDKISDEASTLQSTHQGISKIHADAVIMEHNYSVVTKNKRKSLNCAKALFNPFDKKMHVLRNQISRLRRTATSYKQRLDSARKLSNDAAFNQIVKNMTKPAQLFVHMQLEAKKCPKGRRFTIDEKVLALSLYKRSPKAYALLYKYFTLPSVKGMKRLLGQIKLYPGINPVVFQKIKETMSAKDKHNRLCSLIFDEMSLTPHVLYNIHKDCIEGFTTNKEEMFADHALVFMVKGLRQHFKQPIAYYFTSCLKKNELKDLIKIVIKYAHDAGIILVNTVCDQGAVNVGAITELVNDTKSKYLRLGREWRHDFFCVNNKKIIPIYDTPHLIKGLRNNLLNKDMAYTINNSEKIVKWKYFQMVYAADKSHGELRLLDKITEEHIDPDKINKMKVKTATQIFSHSVAVVTDHLTARGDLPEECKALIDITLLIDNLFDSLNSCTFNIPNGKIYKGPIRRNSPHHELWSKAKKILMTVRYIKKYIQGTKIRIKETTIPSVTNLIKTIEGMEEIWKLMSKKYGFDALLTRNFNQDPVENFFGNIRSYGARNIAPNTVGFEGAFKALLLNNFSAAPSKNTNCIEENSECLENLKFFLTENYVETSDVPQEEISLNTEIILEQTENSDAGQGNYVCGWVLKKLLTNIIKNCKTCRNTLTEKDTENVNSFIRAKEYKKKWLTYPSKRLSDYFHERKNIITGFLKNNATKKNIMKNINLLTDVLVDSPFDCARHKESLMISFNKLTINVIVNSWCRTINRILAGKIIYEGDDKFKNAAQLYCNKHKKYKNRK